MQVVRMSERVPEVKRPVFFACLNKVIWPLSCRQAPGSITVRAKNRPKSRFSARRSRRSACPSKSAGISPDFASNFSP
jgi:hypothetical protein